MCGFQLLAEFFKFGLLVVDLLYRGRGLRVLFNLDRLLRVHLRLMGTVYDPICIVTLSFLVTTCLTDWTSTITLEFRVSTGSRATNQDLVKLTYLRFLNLTDVATVPRPPLSRLGRRLCRS